MARISLIAALGRNTRAIGKKNALLWRIPEDLKRFKALTIGHPVIMGKRTFDSIGTPLPKRPNIVLTQDPSWSCEGVTVCTSVDKALAAAQKLDAEEVFVIGGGSIYAQTIDRADRLYLTLVESDTEGDTFFPPYETLPFTETERVEGEHEGLRYTFSTLDRITH